ncbi:MAG: acyltransferase family protein, partial [Muribaculaceae bacterium]|nr:acyltransferase family protein [Muribaculaceae bacterium]
MSIDMLKCIAAFLVVVIHFTDNSMPTDLAGWVSHFSIAESRIAVPLFFMITGFFYGNMKRRGRLKSQLKKLTIMALGSTTLYILYNLALSYFSGSFNVHEAGIFGWQTLAYLLIFNLTPGAGHLWFFYSMIYALV